MRANGYWTGGGKRTTSYERIDKDVEYDDKGNPVVRQYSMDKHRRFYVETEDYIRSSTYKPITKSEFTITSRQPYGGRLQGYENAYVYDVNYKGYLLCQDAKGFSSKAKASSWLGKFLADYNAWCKDQHDSGLHEYEAVSPRDWVEYGLSDYK